MAQTWSMDPEPDGSVTAVEDAHLIVWERGDGVWWADLGDGPTYRQWHEVLRRGPVTDVTGRTA